MPVRTIARPSSNTTALTNLGVEIIPGDLTDPATIRRAVEGVDMVIHCAARVGDWGPVEDYRDVNVHALATLLEACRNRPLKKFIHLSSLGVYAARHHYGTDETAPLPESHMDGYTQTKLEAEKVVLEAHRRDGIPVVVLRPGFVYGPRDRAVLPKLIDSLRRRRFNYIAGGKYALNSIYVGNVVEAVLLGIDKPQAVGQIYNLTDGEAVSKRRFIETLRTGLNLPPARPISVPLWVARIVAAWLESSARKKNSPKPPKLTQARLKFLGLNLDFSIEKAKRELGYKPRYTFDQGMAETIAWYRDHG
jgi:nucleoside-diphosphate-sugar epimerase